MESSRADNARLLVAIGHAPALLEQLTDDELDAWSQIELAEEFFGPDFSDYLADLARPFTRVQDRLRVSVTFPADTTVEVVVAALLAGVVADLQVMAGDYGPTTLRVSTEDGEQTAADGRSQRRLDVVVRGPEATLDLVDDHVLDRIGPQLQRDLGVLGVDAHVGSHVAGVTRWY